MAGSSLIEVAEAVRSDLDAGTFSQTFEPVVRKYVKQDLKDLTPNELNVFVVGSAERKQQGTRSTIDVEYDVLIGIAMKLEDEADAVIDPLTLLVQEIDDYWDQRVLGGRDELWIASEMQAYSSKHLDEQKVFFGTVKLTFTGTR